MKTVELHDSFYMPWKLFSGRPQCVIESSTLDFDTGRALDTRLNLFVDNILVVFTNGYAAHCAIICIGCLLVDCWRSVEVVTFLHLSISCGHNVLFRFYRWFHILKLNSEFMHKKTYLKLIK